MTHQSNPAIILTATTRGPKAAGHVAGTCQETLDERTDKPGMGNKRQQGGARRRSATGRAFGRPKRATAILGVVHYRDSAGDRGAGLRRGTSERQADGEGRVSPAGRRVGSAGA